MSILDLKVKMGFDGDMFDSRMKKMQKSFERQVRKMEKTGEKLTRSITVPVGIMAGAAVKASIDFEDAFAGVRKTVDATEAQFSGLRKGILDMSKKMPTAAGEIASVAESAGQLGIKTNAILGFTKTMVQLGDTTNLTANESATSFARIANVMQTSQDKFDRMGSVVVDLGNKFATTESEIVDFAQRISGAGKIAGFIESDIFAIGAAFSSVGVESGLGGTAVQKVMIGINTAVAQGNKQLDTFARVAGMSSEQFQKAWKDDAGTAFASFVTGLGEQGDNATTVLDELGLADQRLVRAFLSLANAGSLVNRTLDTGRKAWEENVALTEEADKRYKTISSKLSMLRNRFFALGTSIGDALLPVIDDAITFVGKLTDKFENLESIAKVKILAIAGLLAVSGPLMIAVAKAAKIMSGFVAIVTSKFTLIVAAIGAVITAGIWLKSNWETLSQWSSKIWTSIKNFILETIADLLDGIANFFSFFGGTKSTLNTLSGSIRGLKSEVPGVTGEFTSFGDAAKNLGNNITGLISNLTGVDDAMANFSSMFNDDKIAEKFSLGRGSVSVPQTDNPILSGFLKQNQLAEARLDSMTQGVLRFAKTGGMSLNTIITPALNAAIEAQNRLSQTQQFATSIANDFTQSFGQGLSNVIVQAESLTDSLKNIGKLLASSIIQKGISALLTGGLGGTGFFGKGGGIFGAIFGRDIGGPVMSNQPVLIGKGPQQEIFIPDRSGSIVPNNRLRGMNSRSSGGPQTISVPVYLDGRKIYENQYRVDKKYNR